MHYTINTNKFVRCTIKKEKERERENDATNINHKQINKGGDIKEEKEE